MIFRPCSSDATRTISLFVVDSSAVQELPFTSAVEEEEKAAVMVPIYLLSVGCF